MLSSIEVSTSTTEHPIPTYLHIGMENTVDLPIPPPKRQKRDRQGNLLTPKLPSHRHSSLEQLPSELIQKIFLQCLNFSLPRSSNRLGAILSGDYVYNNLCVLAFDRHMWSARSFLDLPDDENDPIWRSRPLMEDDEQRQLQRDIFLTPWFSLRHVLYVEKRCTRCSRELAYGAEIVKKTAGFDPFDGSIIEFGRNWGKTHHHRHCQKDPGFPHRLLAGPWSKDDVIMIEKLMDWGAGLPSRDSPSMRIARLGLEKAIEQGRSDVIDLFGPLPEEPPLGKKSLDMSITWRMLRIAIVNTEQRQDLVKRLVLLSGFDPPASMSEAADHKAIRDKALKGREEGGGREWLYWFFATNGTSPTLEGEEQQSNSVRQKEKYPLEVIVGRMCMREIEDVYARKMTNDSEPNWFDESYDLMESYDFLREHYKRPH
ncbi:MAG: hypothetical protein M1834_007517 [Cirrosporium novae-zelandiae]|nr:MAG: hypothetical protein M1834_007517 [Cirrosporium novae-zelandiae]